MLIRTLLLAGLAALCLSGCAHRPGDFTPSQDRGVVKFMGNI